MTTTQDGFVVAEKDLAMRGPGEIEGTRQSGALNTKIASIIHDRDWLEKAKIEAELLVGEDINLELAKNLILRQYLSMREGKTAWSRIS
jgi:ATP-dependent DNA helicase RecG